MVVSVGSQSRVRVGSDPCHLETAKNTDMDQCTFGAGGPVIGYE